MNEINVPEFNMVEIKKLLLGRHYHSQDTSGLSLARIAEVEKTAKLIVDYAERCGIIPPQSSMK
jgi:hypothetical protein